MRKTRLRWLCWLALVAFGSPAPVCAQSEHLVGAGVGYSITRNDGTASRGSPDWFIFRIPRPEHLGLAWDVGSETVSMRVSTSDLSVQGGLRIRHFLFGPGYTWRSGILEITAEGLVGAAFYRFTADDPAFSGIPPSVPSSWSAMAGLTAWIDVAPRVGLKLSADYMRARPQYAFANETVRGIERRLHAQIGIVVGIY